MVPDARQRMVIDERTAAGLGPGTPRTQASSMLLGEAASARIPDLDARRLASQPAERTGQSGPAVQARLLTFD